MLQNQKAVTISGAHLGSSSKKTSPSGEKFFIQTFFEKSEEKSD